MATKKSTSNSVYPDMSWQAEDDMRTLCRAEEIKADPKRLAKAQAKAKEKMAEMQKAMGAMAGMGKAKK
jgi:hypothetical protein